MRLFVMLLTVFFIISCGDERPRTDSDFPDTEEEGTLNNPCFSNNTCNEGLECIEGTCVEPTGPAMGELGGECFPNGTCNPGLRCSANECIDDTNPDEIPDTDSDAPNGGECDEGDIKEKVETCGKNNRGTSFYECSNGEWKFFKCRDNDECYDDKTRMTQDICGLNDEGFKVEICVTGEWQPMTDDPETEQDESCTGTDLCKNASEKLSEESCGLNNRGLKKMICENGEWNLINPEKCVDPDECIDDEIAERDVVCGKNNEGFLLKKCVSGQWKDVPDNINTPENESCSGKDVCKNAATRESDQSCGINDAGFLKEECVQGQWSLTDDCYDPDECKNGMEQEKAGSICGLNNRGKIMEICVSGQWQDKAPEECIDPDECTDDDTQDSQTSCGINGTGFITEKCVAGAWSLTEDCNDDDVCENGDTRRVICESNGYRTDTCNSGIWDTSASCNLSDGCTNDDTMTIICPYNSDQLQDYTCTNNTWVQVEFCYDEEITCSHGASRNIPCGTNYAGSMNQTCNSGNWISATCVESETCVDGVVQSHICDNDNVVQKVCINGVFEFINDCGNMPAITCTDAAERTVQNVCGINGRGSITQTCSSDTWTGDTCNDSDECSDGDIKEDDSRICGIYDRGKYLLKCVEGSWTAYEPEVCNDPDTVDIENPVLNSVTITETPIESYYYDTNTLNISIDATDNYEITEYFYCIKYYNGNQATYCDEDSDFTSIGTSNISEITIALDDMDFEVYAYVTDIAGNKSSYGHTAHFFYDASAPICTANYVDSDIIYPGLDDSSLNGDDNIFYYSTADIDDSIYDNVNLQSYQLIIDGDVHTEHSLMVDPNGGKTFDMLTLADGEYTFQIKSVDMVGRECVAGYKPLSFTKTIDQTAPVVTADIIKKCSGQIGEEVNNSEYTNCEDLELQFTVEDPNFEPESIDCVINVNGTTTDFTAINTDGTTKNLYTIPSELLVQTNDFDRTNTKNSVTVVCTDQIGLESNTGGRSNFWLDSIAPEIVVSFYPSPIPASITNSGDESFIVTITTSDNNNSNIYAVRHTTALPIGTGNIIQYSTESGTTNTEWGCGSGLSGIGDEIWYFYAVDEGNNISNVVEQAVVWDCEI